MKIIVTGGAGFIGSHVVDAYIAAGHSVAVIDDLSKGTKKNLNPKATFYKADIRNTGKIADIIRKEKPDVINHHAAIAAVTANNPMETYEVNVMGTLNLLAASKSISKFIFASTGGAMYGRSKTLPATESEERTPASAYGLSKLLGEDAIAFYAHELGFPYTIFRYANVFGPRQNPKGEAGIVAIFSELIANNKQPTIYNKEATRDYVYVSDIATANLLALSKGSDATLNLGTGAQTTNQQIFETVAKEYGNRPEPRYEAARPGELAHSALDATLAKKVLGWQPTVTLIQGVHTIHDWKN